MHQVAGVILAIVGLVILGTKVRKYLPNMKHNWNPGALWAAFGTSLIVVGTFLAVRGF